ncbi:MAG: hypothetical protein K2G06_08870, partial [Muribaculaceae bacterium]|nr:hypothetical protein [Muribaculaceae bacterium]
AKLILIFPRLIIAFGALLCKETAATMLLIVRMLRLVAAVFNRGKFSSATPSWPGREVSSCVTLLQASSIRFISGEPYVRIAIVLKRGSPAMSGASSRFISPGYLLFPFDDEVFDFPSI